MRELVQFLTGPGPHPKERAMHFVRDMVPELSVVFFLMFVSGAMLMTYVLSF